jgi:hypothetical protein
MPAEWIKWKRSRSGKKSWEYEYPPELDSLLRRNRIPPNTRMRNGPPQTTYQFAGGGYTTVNDPEHHHIYDGNDRHSMSPVDPLHAVNHPSHLTQSAGIVVLTHDAHRHCHTDAHLRLLLRLIAWLNFGYDPEKLFGPTRDDGFAENYSSEKVYPPT